jgi:hypothetical protein
MDDKEMADFDKKYAEEGAQAAAFAVANKLELRKINFQERMSEETNCFVAEIHKAGKWYATAHNDGHGGNTCVDGHKEQLSPEEYALLERWADDTLEAYLKSKETARLDKWIDKNVAKFTAKGLSTAVIRKGNEISLVPTKCQTVPEFFAQHPDKQFDSMEIRR